MVPILLEESVRIPADIVDLESFRRWARSEQFPEYGWFSYLHGEIWVDLSMEQLFTHNQVKIASPWCSGTLVENDKSGLLLLGSGTAEQPRCGLSTEPDGVFVTTTRPSAICECGLSRGRGRSR